MGTDSGSPLAKDGGSVKQLYVAEAAVAVAVGCSRCCSLGATSTNTPRLRPHTSAKMLSPRLVM
jgi:hypothetical protein